MISVCLASFNGDQFIVEQLISILCQLGENDEIVVSDDNSSDTTILKINSLKDPRIRIITNNKRSGVIGNFENALQNAKYDIIFLSDQDDIWKPNKVDIMIEYLKSADLIVSDSYFINTNGEISNYSFFDAYSSREGIVKNFIKNTYLGNCMAFNRKVLEAALPFPAQLYKASKYSVYHDVWIGLLANTLFRVKFVPEQLSFYRRHSNNASPTDGIAVSPNKNCKKIKARTLLFWGLLLRVILIKGRKK